MNAANFTTFSTGIGSYGMAISASYLINYPQELTKLRAMGIIDFLPRNKSADDRPAHQYDAKYAQSCSMLVDGSLPNLLKLQENMDTYMSRVVWACHPLDKIFD